MARIVQENDVAWALAEAIKPHLSTLERNHVFAAIGAGDAFAAIRHLFKSVALARIPLRPDLVQQCTTWLHAYVGHNDERYLRRLIEDYLVPYSMNVPATVRVSHLTTTSKPGQLVALPAQRHRFDPRPMSASASAAEPAARAQLANWTSASDANSAT